MKRPRPDMNPRETSKKIDDIAAQWVTRLDRGPITAGEQNELDRWLAVDPRHLGSFARARAISVHLERARALGVDFDPKCFTARPDSGWLTRRGALYFGSGAIAAAAITTVALIPNVSPTSEGHKYATQLGEIRPVPLADGSVITLNTASEVVVSFTRPQRIVHLLRGEALFDVAKDAARPFFVLAGAASIRAVGTSFGVTFLPQQPTSVVVREGVVEVNRAAATNHQSLRLAANMRAIVPAETPMTALALSAEDVERQLMWREGRIAFEGSSLADAAAVYARYSQTRIVFADPSIARETITGLFVTNDPIGFSKAVAISLGLHFRIGDNEVELSR